MISPYAYHCTVYHGTNLFCAKLIQSYGINLIAQRNMTDFGKGFYVTPNIRQAKEWANVKAQNPQINTAMLEAIDLNKNNYLNHPESKIPTYITFNLSLSRLLQLNGLVFPMPYETLWHEYKKYWEAFVQNCRIGLQHHFDFVYGPVGRRHNGSFSKVKPTKLKEQISLNSIDALQCLSNLKITILSRIGTQHHDKTNIDHYRMTTINDNYEINHPFLNDMLEVLMNIGHLSRRSAIDLINNSWIANQINQLESIIGHEPREYWAFSILYEKKLWYQDYETYIRKYQHKNL